MSLRGLRRLATGCPLLLFLALVPSSGAGSDLAPAQVLYVAPAGVDTGTCTAKQPCASLDRAYVLARPGAIVKLAGGRYGAQAIQYRPGRRAPKVIFEPATAAPVTVTGELIIRATQLELRRMTLNNLELPRDAANVVLRNVSNHGFWIEGATNISFIGGEVTCGRCPFHPFLVDGGPPDNRPPRQILFDGVDFHDWQTTTADQHTECLQILSGDGITIRNSVFRQCATADNGRGATANLHISFFGDGPTTRNILVENNFFYRSGNSYAIQSGDYQNVDFRFNSISGPMIVFGGFGDGTPVELVGNVMGFSGCKAPRLGTGVIAPLVFRHNVLGGGRCHSTDKNAPSGFIDPNTNLRLRPGAAAINAGDPKRYPRRDIDGQLRPRGGRPDAGADELR